MDTHGAKGLDSLSFVKFAFEIADLDTAEEIGHVVFLAIFFGVEFLKTLSFGDNCIRWMERHFSTIRKACVTLPIPSGTLQRPHQKGHDRKLILDVPLIIKSPQSSSKKLIPISNLKHGRQEYTAAMNCANLDNDPEKSWCPLNCGQCYKLCSTGGSTQGRPQKAGWKNWRTDDFFLGGNIDAVTSMKWWVCFVVFVFCLVLGSYHVVCRGCL